MKKVLTASFILFLFIRQPVCSQVAINIQKNFGGSSNDFPGNHSLINTNDGGYAIGGTASSSDGDVSFNHGGNDYWLVKLDSNYNLQWEKTYGGSLSDWLYSTIQTSDGGFLMTGYTNSNNGNVTGHHGLSDYWVVKTDPAGNLQWQKTLGGSNVDYGSDAVETYDGGFAVAGYSSSIDGDVSVPLGQADYWLVKLDASGNILWDKSYGGSNADNARSIIQAHDSCLVISGSAGSNDSDVTGYLGGWDFWIVKTDPNGILLWEKSLGGNTEDYNSKVIEASDNGFVLSGSTKSNTNYVSGNHGGKDAWMVKIDSAGNFQWQRCSGGILNDEFMNVIETADQGYIASGAAFSIDGDLSFNHGYSDQWVVKTDSAGNLLWQRPVGGTTSDNAFDIIQNSKGRYVTTGFNFSSDGDVNKGGDVWMAELTDQYSDATGKMYFDLNSNSVKDVSEPNVINRKVAEQNTGRFTYSFSDGTYDLTLVDTGQFTLVPPFANIYYAPVPAQHTANFSAPSEVDSLNDFAYQPTGTYNDLCVTLTPLGNFRANSHANYRINYENTGTTTVNGTVIFFPDNLYTLYSYSSVTPASVTADSIVWNIGPITPMQTGSIIVNVYIYLGTPLGTPIHSEARIEPVAGDANTACNYAEWTVYVTGPYDPNAILVDRDTVLTTELPSPPYLNYVIYFQNVGNDTAFNVRVMNNIPQMLDISSFEFITSSHPVNINYGAHSRLMEFNFDNILLPDSNANEPGSHGFVRYRIKPLSSLVAGDSIKNNAAIYFDFNEPVLTDTAVTQIILPTGVNDFHVQRSMFKVFPNPATGIVLIHLGKLLGASCSLGMYDLFGREVFKSNLSQVNQEINPSSGETNSEIKIDVSGFTAGIYLLEIKNENTFYRTKLVKQ
ncbi:MAG TPA: T9SS type A sorting domain-containing protein [Bacteroidia bacterium]|nr:T9SS type A sorting domain-containing protein [Bacteroidia bacterium]